MGNAPSKSIIAFTVFFLATLYTSLTKGKQIDNNTKYDNGTIDSGFMRLKFIPKYIYITDLSGRVISQSEEDIETLPPGIYIITQTDENGTVLFSSEYTQH